MKAKTTCFGPNRPSSGVLLSLVQYIPSIDIHSFVIYGLITFPLVFRVAINFKLARQ